MSDYSNDRQAAMDSRPQSGYRISHAKPKAPPPPPRMFADGKWANRAVILTLVLAAIAVAFAIPKGPY